MLATHCKIILKLKWKTPIQMWWFVSTTTTTTFPSMTNQKVAHPLPLAVVVAPSHLQVETRGRWAVLWIFERTVNPSYLNDFRLKEPPVLVLWKKIGISKTPENQGGFFFSWINWQSTFLGGGIHTRITLNRFGLKPMLADSLILIRTSQFRV